MSSGPPRLAAAVLVASALLPAACSALGPSRELEIGRHRVTLRAPRGWDYLDHGYEKRFRRDLSYVDVLDLGPIEGASYARELAAAREHWQTTRARVGYSETSPLLAPRELFPSKEAFELQSTYRRKLVEGYQQGDDAGVETHFEALLELLRGLAPLELDAVTQLVLERLDFKPWRSEVMETRDVVVDGRRGRSLRTWNKRTHEDRQRLAFLVSDGNLLAVETSGDLQQESSAAFERILGSLRFAATR